MSHHADPIIVNGVAYVSKAVNPNDCEGCAAERDGQLCRKLSSAGDGDCFARSVIFVKKEEPMTTENQQVTGVRVVSAERTAAINQALGLPIGAAFVTARQAAWDRYRDSRAKVTGNNIPSNGPRQEGYEQGFADGFAARDPQVAALRLMQPAPVVRKAGKLADLIVASLRDEGPASAETLSKRIGRPLNSVSPRTRSLIDHGLIHVSGGEPALHGKGNRWVFSYGPYPL